MRKIAYCVLSVAGVLLLAACATRSPERAAEARAQYEFKRIVRAYQVPAVDATNEVDRAVLLDTALDAFAALREAYPTSQPWAAMALRQIGVIQAEQGRRKEALATFAKVDIFYPNESWEVIQAWKAAGDLLWDSGMRRESLPFYRDIVEKFDRPGQPEMFGTIVRIAKDRIRTAGGEKSRGAP
ncbi:MAG: hypothetical protein H3C50_05340 [Kiritimatiellae bacterium]|nr:hypothetical protein [Kiritimatiellia bacterium]MCO5067258.1 hypothetical protein [Kiritimatiellia bacterium]